MRKVGYSGRLRWRNKDVNWMNDKVRQKLGVQRQLLFPGEQVYLEKSWMGKDLFLLRGESGVVLEANPKVHHYANLRYMNVRLAFKDVSRQMKVVSTLVCLDVLQSEKGMLTYDQRKHLYAHVMKHNRKFRSSLNILHDRYLSAMELRYGYALTCHKAQGGEWEEVYLNPYYKQTDYRWLYTAITRASKEVYSWGLPEKYLKYLK